MFPCGTSLTSADAWTRFRSWYSVPSPPGQESWRSPLVPAKQKKLKICFDICKFVTQLMTQETVFRIRRFWVSQYLQKVLTKTNQKNKKSRIRTRKSSVRIHGSVPKCHGSGTLRYQRGRLLVSKSCLCLVQVGNLRRMSELELTEARGEVQYCAIRRHVFACASEFVRKHF